MIKTASSSLVSGFYHLFSHRMSIRCFLTSIIGQEDTPSERSQSRQLRGRRPSDVLLPMDAIETQYKQ